MIRQDNIFSVKTHSKQEQCSRSIRFDETKDDQIGRTTISNFTLFRWSTKNTSRSAFEINEEQMATRLSRLSRSEARKLHQARHEQEMSQVDTLELSNILYIRCSCVASVSVRGEGVFRIRFLNSKLESIQQGASKGGTGPSYEERKTKLHRREWEGQPNLAKKWCK